jgi:predicted exporter
VIAPALKPFAANASLEQDQPLTSTDRTTRLFLAVTNQPSIGAFDCQALMKKVNAFRARASEDWEGGAPLEVLVTGRSAYVAEISLSMRHDIVVTLLGSILLVGGVFYVGFRRWLPLVGMGFSLLLCCLIALAAGLLIFGELNMVTIGMCAILIGLGVDFAILIFGRYNRRGTRLGSRPRDRGSDRQTGAGDFFSEHSPPRSVFSRSFSPVRVALPSSACSSPSASSSPPFS